MTNLSNALEQLRMERGKAQAQVEKLEQAISVIESLNGSVGSRSTGSRRTPWTSTCPWTICWR